MVLKSHLSVLSFLNEIDENHLLNHFFHLFIEFRFFFCFYMIHHTVVFENKNVKTSFTTSHIDAAV